MLRSLAQVTNAKDRSKTCMGQLKRQQHAVRCTCTYCKTPFQVKRSEAAEGRGKFCSSDCFHANNRVVLPTAEILHLWETGLSCRQIATALDLSPFPIKRWLLEQDIYEPRRKGKNHGRYLGTQSRSMRKEIVERANNACERCGYNTTPAILQIHHRDRNRKNNEHSNLELLCPNCHETEHLQAGDGRYGGIRLS